jgi:hypothetical protein
MPVVEAKRTLVKSGPELWAELSDPGALARHLGPFGSVRITRTVPDTLVEWEGDHASGTVRLEPSGFGTRVVLTASSGAEAEPEPEPTPEPQPPAPQSFLARLLRRRPPEPEEAPEPEPVAEPTPADDALLRVLTDCLDALGAARHRPFSRV